jgi:predicted XRE-type DNA-binding protein
MRKNKYIGSTLDDFLQEEEVLEAFEARAIKEVVAWQLQQAMKQRKLSKARMAAAMGTSRTQINRLLNPDDGNVTLATLQRAALVVGRKVRLELV